MKMPTRKGTLQLVGLLCAVYLLAIMAVARIPGNLREGPRFGPRLMIWMGEGEGSKRFSDASIVHASMNSFFGILYAPFFSAAGFNAAGEPNFVARWIFGVDFDLSDPPPMPASGESKERESESTEMEGAA